MNTALHDSGDTAGNSFRPVANQCTAGSCPTVYVNDAGTVVVQGFSLSAEQIGLAVGDGEALVEVPLELLAEAVRNLS